MPGATRPQLLPMNWLDPARRWVIGFSFQLAINQHQFTLHALGYCHLCKNDSITPCLSIKWSKCVRVLWPLKKRKTVELWIGCCLCIVFRAVFCASVVIVIFRSMYPLGLQTGDSRITRASARKSLVKGERFVRSALTPTSAYALFRTRSSSSFHGSFSYGLVKTENKRLKGMLFDCIRALWGVAYFDLWLMLLTKQ